eukprot:2108625-Rhodomonas_salina.1
MNCSAKNGSRTQTEPQACSHPPSTARASAHASAAKERVGRSRGRYRGGVGAAAARVGAHQRAPRAAMHLREVAYLDVGCLCGAVRVASRAHGLRGARRPSAHALRHRRQKVLSDQAEQHLVAEM